MRVTYLVYCFTFIDGIIYTLIKIAIIILLLYLGRNQSVVNVKQCSKRRMNDGKEYGLLFVSTLVTLSFVTCVSMNLLSLFLQSMSVIIYVLFLYAVHYFIFR